MLVEASSSSGLSSMYSPVTGSVNRSGFSLLDHAQKVFKRGVSDYSHKNDEIHVVLLANGWYLLNWTATGKDEATTAALCSCSGPAKKHAHVHIHSS